jgi:hypothetical protein
MPFADLFQSLNLKEAALHWEPDMDSVPGVFIVIHCTLGGVLRHLLAS